MEIKLPEYIFLPDEQIQYKIGTKLWGDFSANPDFKIKVREIILRQNSYKLSDTPKVFAVKSVIKDLEAICLDENQTEVKLPLDKFYFAVAK